MIQFSSVSQPCLILCDPMNRSMPGFMSIELVVPSSHLILYCPLLLMPPIPPSIRVFSNESTLHMRWPKYWSFSFSIIPERKETLSELYLKLQNFGHLMRKVDSLEKTLMLGGIGGRRRRGREDEMAGWHH